MDNPLNLPPVAALASRRTTPDHVADSLREAILTGGMADGQELNQVALAEHFAVSRVPVREALRQLQAEGLIRQEAHRRAVVTTLSRERIMELFDLRVRLETYMLERAIVAIDAADLAALDALVADMDDISDHQRWLEYNRRFHQRLNAVSGAIYTQELAAQIAARTTRYLYLRSGGAGIDRIHEAHAEHLEILDAAKARDLHRASRTLEHHIDGTRRRVDEFLRSLPEERTAAAEGTA